VRPGTALYAAWAYKNITQQVCVVPVSPAFQQDPLTAPAQRHVAHAAFQQNIELLITCSHVDIVYPAQVNRIARGNAGIV
jgi:hypothetical protein